MVIILIVLIIIVVMYLKNKDKQCKAEVLGKDYVTNTEIVEEKKQDKYRLINKYAEEDMSAFLKEHFDWETTPTLQERNMYSIKNENDIDFINVELKNQIDFINGFVNKNSITVPVFKSNRLPSERIGYSKENEICTFSFTPFTPTGRVKKVNYTVSIDTFPGEQEIDFSKVSMDELTKRNNDNPRDGFIFGSMEFDKNYTLVRATYHHWKNHKRTSYTIGKKDNEYIMKKLVKQSLNELELGKPEKVLVKDNCLV